jgi:hypothetical protein
VVRVEKGIKFILEIFTKNWNDADSDILVHGYIRRLDGPFSSAWQTKYAKLYPSRLELHPIDDHNIPEAGIFLNF